MQCDELALIFKEIKAKLYDISIPPIACKQGVPEFSEFGLGKFYESRNSNKRLDMPIYLYVHKLESLNLIR